MHEKEFSSFQKRKKETQDNTDVDELIGKEVNILNFFEKHNRMKYNFIAAKTKIKKRGNLIQQRGRKFLKTKKDKWFLGLNKKRKVNAGQGDKSKELVHKANTNNSILQQNLSEVKEFEFFKSFEGLTGNIELKSNSKPTAKEGKIINFIDDKGVETNQQNFDFENVLKIDKNLQLINNLLSKSANATIDNIELQSRNDTTQEELINNQLGNSMDTSNNFFEVENVKGQLLVKKFLKEQKMKLTGLSLNSIDESKIWNNSYDPKFVNSALQNHFKKSNFISPSANNEQQILINLSEKELIKIQCSNENIIRHPKKKMLPRMNKEKTIEFKKIMEKNSLMIEIEKKLQLYFIEDVDLFSHTNSKFEETFFRKILLFKKKKKNEQKEKYLFLKIYKYFEYKLLKKIQSSHLATNRFNLVLNNLANKNFFSKNQTSIKKNKDFFRVFNFIYFEEKSLKSSEIRVFNPKNQKMRFNHGFIRKIFNNGFFKKKSKALLQSKSFDDFIIQDINQKIELMTENIFIDYFKYPKKHQNSEFSNKINRSKIPWSLPEILVFKNIFFQNFMTK